MAMVENGDHEQSNAMLHYCKMCNRGFGSGGALGGHMRAHNIAEVINRIQEKQPPEFQDKPEGNKHSYFLRRTSNRFLSLHSEEYGKHTLDGEKVLPILSYVSEAAGSRKAYLWKFLGPKDDDENSDEFHASREEEDVANFLVTLSNNSNDDHKNKPEEETKGLFQCKACKKVFSSHQALGGHRASHKKVKGCFASTIDNLTNEEMFDKDSISHDEFSIMPLESDNLNHTMQGNILGSKRKSKGHQCSICHRVFSSGQALGGHKRCHWIQNGSAFVPNFHDQFQYYGTQNCEKSVVNLNLFPLANNTSENSTRIYVPRVQNVEENQNYHKRDVENLSFREEDGINKQAKLSNVRELELEGGSSSWLQVGLATTSTD